jgi:hypothetical protein
VHFARIRKPYTRCPSQSRPSFSWSEYCGFFWTFTLHDTPWSQARSYCRPPKSRIYSVTQLAMWLSKPDFDRTPLDPDPDDQQAMDTSRTVDLLVVVKECCPRSSIIMAKRLRRGMSYGLAQYGHHHHHHPSYNVDGELEGLKTQKRLELLVCFFFSFLFVILTVICK